MASVGRLLFIREFARSTTYDSSYSALAKNASNRMVTKLQLHKTTFFDL